MKGFGQLVLIGAIGLALLVALVFLLRKNYNTNVNTNGQGSEGQRFYQKNNGHDFGEEGELPSGLSLPFKTSDIDLYNGEVNPLGVVRFSKDQADVGHPGIDFPLDEGASVYAVADGEIVLIDSAGDPWNGMKVFQLLINTGKGEGWAFNYEHIIPAEGVSEGDFLKRGDLVGNKAAPAGFTAHFQLSRIFNDLQYTKDPVCWPEKLDANGSQDLQNWWNTYRTSNILVDAWRTNVEEGQYPFRGLLDKQNYSGGPQMCYELGTDVR